MPSFGILQLPGILFLRLLALTGQSSSSSLASACYSSATNTDTASARTFPLVFSFCLAAFIVRPQKRQQRIL